MTCGADVCLIENGEWLMREELEVGSLKWEDERRKTEDRSNEELKIKNEEWVEARKSAPDVRTKKI